MPLQAPVKIVISSIITLLLVAGCVSAQKLTSLSTSANVKSDDPVLREKTQVVTLNVSVIDRENHPILGLTRDNFEIYENKVRQKIEYFAETDDPVSVGIIFDVSGSMESKISKAQEALKAFVATSHPDDDFFLVTFNETAQLVADFVTGDLVVDKLSHVKTSGQTAMYDAIYLGLEKIKQGRHPRKVLLVISDGEDNHSRFSLGDLKKFTKESDAVIYCFSISETMSSGCGRVCQMFARRAMEEISALTGGKAFFPSQVEDLENATSQIALELRRQYSIGYVPTQNTRDGKWRKILTKVKDSERKNEENQKWVVRTKEGYYAIP